MKFSKFIRLVFITASPVAIGLAMVGGVENAISQTADGSTASWNLDGTRLTTNIVGSTMSGNYVEDNGRISGTLSGNVFDGYWAEDSSGQRCTSQRLGTFYWGRTRWEFHASGFQGRWGYCEAAPITSWTGTLISGTSPYGLSHISGSKPDANTSTAAGLGGHSHVWNTSEGTLSASANGAAFSGTYNNDNGRIGGTLNGNVLDGYWGEDSSGKRCSVQRLGTFYWGRIRWTFTNAGFSGQYGYCDAQFSGNWNGTLVGTPTVATPKPLPDPIRGTSIWNLDGKRLTLRADSNGVTGSYTEDNGRLSGTISGNILDGYWGEDSSGQRCSSQRLGTYYWGRIRFVFDGPRFIGHWGYCDATPTSAWNGTLIEQQ